MNLQDAMYNWLSIKVVADERKTDQAAQDTSSFFEEILTEDHGVTNIAIEVTPDYYVVTYRQNDQEESKKFPIELIDALLLSIQNEPKYNQ
ncbi:hypothetical protein [Pseudalkalibacillus hwajinpoensis]|uniref:Uncharacterized protein n=1 Tax=Guptibacillus hwajinpoensis TaxID=208199 RepID=A0A4U1MM64_9BACL|nr:hypothetical protein [Pseudalkalibacillus hwajinpoensis]TKD71801.1 hypothetical protein FBF83_03085 [Pseudalkalibacillus hwajinpoensis]